MRSSLKALFLSAALLGLGSPSFADVLDASDDRPLVEADLFGMDAVTLRLARNEIFARHGYRFNSADLTAYFSQFPWYSPRTRKVSLSRVEDMNVAFIKSYEGSPALLARLRMAPVAPAPTTVVVVQQNPQGEVPAELQREFDRMNGEIESLKLLLESQKSKGKDVGGQGLATEEISRLIAERTPALARFEAENNGKYLTPIRPTVDVLKLSARQVSEYWPRVPYYRPGKVEQGEFFLSSVVSDQGFGLYRLSFLDPASNVQTVTDTWEYSTDEIGLMLGGLRDFLKARDKLAASGITKVYQKRMVCFPEAQCGEKKEGNTSTEVILTMNEDGAIGAQLVRNRGRYAETYAVSAPSAALLASYFDFMIEYGTKELVAGSVTDADIDKLLEE